MQHVKTFQDFTRDGGKEILKICFYDMNIDGAVINLFVVVMNEFGHVIKILRLPRSPVQSSNSNSFISFDKFAQHGGSLSLLSGCVL